MGLTQKLGTIPLAILTDASNNIGIGGSPSGSYKLDVTGTGRFSSNIGIATTLSSWGNTFGVMQSYYGSYFGGTSTGGTVMGNNNYYDGTNYKYINTDYATQYQQGSGEHFWRTATSGTAGGNITFTERMRITNAGNVGIGTNSPSDFGAGYTTLGIDGSSYGGVLDLMVGGTRSLTIATDGGNPSISARISGQSIIFRTNGGAGSTERMRIQSDGRIIKAANNLQTGQFQIGGQTGSPPNAILVSAADENGPYPIGIKALSATPSQGLFGFFNSANATQGSITINGSDVSYNSFMGSHWSQLSDNSKPEILKGTILEAIDELCKWEKEINDRLPKIKISDTIESKNVYGVFFDWDNMDDFNDMYVAALGAGYIRVNSNEVVSMGDLLQSNGDGTAKVQSDDIMRSSTIAKVISTQKIETYPDGSYLIAATLHCG